MTKSSKAVPRLALVEPFEDVCNADEAELARLEPAWGKAALFFRTGYRLGHPDASLRCQSLLQVYELLEVYRKRFEAGKTLSLLQAVAVCAEENLPLPAWLADAFCRSMANFLRPGKLYSLDQVFHSGAVPAGSAKKAAAVRQDWQLGVSLSHHAWELAREDETLTSFDAVIERLLKSCDFGVRKTNAKRLINMVEASQSEFLRKDLSLSHFLQKRRKPKT